MCETDSSLDSVADRIAKLFFTADMSDCEFLFSNNEKIKAHKNVLGSASPVFKAMLYGELGVNIHPIKIEDIEPIVFKNMLEYLYTDQLEFTSVEMACLLCAVGEKYMLSKLKKHCEEYILLNINTATVFDILELLKLFDNKIVKDECAAFIRSETKALLDTENFLYVDVSILRTIVEQPALNINTEVELFHAIEKWAKSRAEENELSLEEVSESLTDVLSGIRFLTMGAEAFARGPGISELINTEDRLHLLLNINAPGICTIPKNFCPFRKPRSVRMKFQYTFAGVSNLSSSGVHSPEFKMGPLSWQLQAFSKIQNSRFTHAIFYVMFRGNSLKPTASCSASVEMKLVSHKKGGKHYITRFRQTFFDGENTWNNPHSIEWFKMLDERNGFVKDNRITIEVSVEPDPEPEEHRIQINT